MGRRGRNASTPNPDLNHWPAWRRPWYKPSERLIVFAEGLKVTSGMLAGQNFRVRPWQREFIEQIYDPRDEHHRRIVRTALLTIPRKNGKSGIASVLALAHLCGPMAEPRGQVYAAAADRFQSSIMFSEIEALILADPILASRCNIKRFTKEIEDVVNGSVFIALSAEVHNKHGLSPSFVVYDELAQAPDRQLYDVLMTGMGARQQPLMVVISTQSADAHHCMAELTEDVRKINDGKVKDPTMIGRVYAAPENADPWDEQVWADCNPALGDFRSLADMRALASRAKRMPSLEATFRLLYLNQPLVIEPGFIAPTEWDACNAVPDITQLKDRPCYVGIDLSETRDLTAVVAYFPDDDGAVITAFWLPSHGLADRAAEDRVPYDHWHELGLLDTTPGRTIGADVVIRYLDELQATYDVRGIAYDRWRIKALLKLAEDNGLSLPLLPFGQGFQDMAPAIDALERAVIDRKLAHGGNPILRWNLSNCRVQTDPAGNRKLVKRRDRARIDGIVSLVMATGIAHKGDASAGEYKVDEAVSLVLSA